MPLYPPPPIAELPLPGWECSVQESWAGLERTASRLATGAGIGRNFRHLVDAAATMLREGGELPLGDRRFVRAVLTAWFDDPDLARATMTCARIAEIRNRATFSRLSTITAASILFEHFDLLGTWEPGLFDLMGSLVRYAAATERRADVVDVVETVRQRGDLLGVNGPLTVASEVAASGGDIGAWFRAHQMSAYSDTRFGRTARDAYYLRAIQQADPERSDHPFLTSVTSEVRLRERTQSSDIDRLSFGHAVLEALTSKNTRHPSPEWLAAVLEIGGDPRRTQSSQWKMWWSRVSEASVRRAIRWMRGMDLRAFLDGVEAYAKATRNDDMERMLERRKRLLLGLYEQDRVEDVRLILGSDIRKWIRRSALVGDLDEAVLEDGTKSDTAVIYLNCVDFSLVEGSHNFTLHVYVGGPLPWIADRTVTRFASASLRETFPARHVQAHGAGTYLALRHGGFEWLRRALDFLRERGVRLDERGLMTGPDFAELLRRRAGWN